MIPVAIGWGVMSGGVLIGELAGDLALAVGLTAVTVGTSQSVDTFDVSTDPRRAMERRARQTANELTYLPQWITLFEPLQPSPLPPAPKEPFQPGSIVRNAVIASASIMVNSDDPITEVPDCGKALQLISDIMQWCRDIGMMKSSLCDGQLSFVLKGASEFAHQSSIEIDIYQAGTRCLSPGDMVVLGKYIDALHVLIRLMLINKNNYNHDGVCSNMEAIRQLLAGFQDGYPHIFQCFIDSERLMSETIEIGE